MSGITKLKWLKELPYCPKFGTIKPLSPYLNGKVERTQRTDLDEFYSNLNLKDPELVDKLKSWEEYYNCRRSHSSLNGKTPREKYEELKAIIPLVEEVYKSYDVSKEPLAVQNYQYDQALKLITKQRGKSIS